MADPTATGRPGCPGCGDAPARGRVFCGACWTDAPAAARTALDRTQKAMGRNPASRQVREAYAIALSDAAGYLT